MISYMLVYHPKPEGPIISELYALFKFGYSLLTLKEGPKVKSDHTITFRAHDFLLVGFTLQISRTNNKQDIDNFKVRYVGYFGTPWMTLN